MQHKLQFLQPQHLQLYLLIIPSFLFFHILDFLIRLERVFPEHLDMVCCDKYQVYPEMDGTQSLK